MIAIITSCINPFQDNENVKSFINIEERIKQTIFTIENLVKYNFKSIYLIDNSASLDLNWIPPKLINLINIIHIKQFQFNNKGINELLMLLTIVDQLPENEQIFKISGRYLPNQNFDCSLNSQCDFKVKAYKFTSRTGTISTRGYFVSNKNIFKEFLLMCLNEVIVYPKRFVGIRSSIKNINQIFFQNTKINFNTSIEFASLRVLKINNYKLQLVDIIGIEGKIAGFEKTDYIIE